MNISIARQLSVAIENQPGRLASMARALAAAGINIKALSVVDNVEQGMIRVITSDATASKALLQSEGLYVVEADVVVMVLPDSLGVLAAVSQALADAQINIDYAYGSEDSSEKHVRLILKVSNSTKAAEVLRGLPEFSSG